MIRIDFTGKNYFNADEKLFIGRMIETVNLVGESQINKSLFIFSRAQYEYALIASFLKAVYLHTMLFLTKDVERKKDTLIFRSNGKEVFRVGDVSSSFDLNELTRIMEK
jgi:hypothetical protein